MLAVRLAKNRFTSVGTAAMGRADIARYSWRGVTTQTNWMLKIQFEGFAVRFIRSPRSLQTGLAHISKLKRNYFALTRVMFKCLF